MTVGIDLVKIDDFQKRFSVQGMLEKVFTQHELTSHKNTKSLAGVFAAKEAFMKAIGEKIDWLDVWLEILPSGKPTIYSNSLDSNQKAEVSISHDGDYATAVVIIL